MTTVMRLAEARRAASTMISCSMMVSLMPSVDAQWLCTMNTSVPRTDSLNLQCSSPLANSSRLGVEQRHAERPAISSASSGWPGRRPGQLLLGDQLHAASWTLSSLPARRWRPDGPVTAQA
jgi:hypothetical protein